jgi:hypothetical protein
MHRFFSNSGNIQLFPVTSLEEMAIAETLEMAESMANDFGVACSALLVNCASPMCSVPDEGIAGLSDTTYSSPALRFAVQRGLMERERCKQLRASLPVPQVLVPRFNHSSSDLDLISRIGDGIEFSHFS